MEVLPAVNDDVQVLALVLVALAIWGWIAFRRWMLRPASVPAPSARERVRPSEITELLSDHGYEVTHGKRKIGIKVLVNGKELGSSLFVDYFARKDGRTYVVKVAKPRMPVDLHAGSAVREKLLPYALLYDDTAGVLYVDAGSRQIYQIRFELEL